MTKVHPVDSKPPPPTGLLPEELDPQIVWGRTEVLLAQAETLERLRRTEDQQRKLLWTFAVAYYSFKLHPNSVLAALNAARIARTAKQFKLASDILRIAHTLNPNQEDSRSIEVEAHRLERERDIDAQGSLDAMARQLIVYACHHCGRLIEYISIPCMFCGWQPLTIDEMAQSGRVATPWFSLWELFGIGRGIATGRKAIEVVSNLTDSAAASMQNATYRSYVESALQEAQKKHSDGFFCYLDEKRCQNCGTSLPRHNPFVTNCPKCKVKVRIAPPLKLLSCLARSSIHFQHNLQTDERDELHLFIRYLVSLQSKLFRQQETPSSAERHRVIELMTSLGEFEANNDYGCINLGDPRNIVFRESGRAEKGRAVTVLDDFAQTLQFLANWMLRTKALC